MSLRGMTLPSSHPWSLGIDFLVVSSAERELPEILEKFITSLSDKRRELPGMYRRGTQLERCDLALQATFLEEGPLPPGLYFFYQPPHIFSEPQMRTILRHMELLPGDVYDLYCDGVPSKAMMIESNAPFPSPE